MTCRVFVDAFLEILPELENFFPVKNVFKGSLLDIADHNFIAIKIAAWENISVGADDKFSPRLVAGKIIDMSGVLWYQVGIAIIVG